MTSEKSYDNAQRIDALVPRVGALETAPVPGPYTVFTPLLNTWGTGGGWAKVRWFPGNMIFMTMLAATAGTAADGTQLATIPSTDASGNNLRPAQQVIVNSSTNVQRLGTAAPDPATGNTSGLYVSITSAGNVFIHGVAAAATFLAINGWYMTDTM